jgi:hypothetical protein
MDVGSPRGLWFDPPFLSTNEERRLLVELEQLDFRPLPNISLKTEDTPLAVSPGLDIMRGEVREA